MFFKMKKHLVFALAFLLLLLVACQKDPDVGCDMPTNDLALSRKLIVGTWRWDRTVRFFDTNQVIKPLLMGDQVELIFKKNGIVEYYVGGRLNDTSSYEIDVMKKYTLFYADTTVNTLYIRNLRSKTLPSMQSLVPIRICNDSLFLKYESFRYHTGDNYFYRIN
jgi:hypothetical protein